MANKLPTFLIVDDSAITRAIIGRVIRMTGLPLGSLVEAADGRQALDLMQTCPVTLVLADLNMPVMNGLEMIAEMRRHDHLKNVPVIVISAQPEAEQIASLKCNGANKYLAKPFTPEGVREAIESILSPTKSNRALAPPDRHLLMNLTLAEALTEALETMAFISPEALATAGPDPVDDLRQVRVPFRGDSSKGSLSLSASKRFGAAIARNCAMLDAGAKADDALKELANVTCGLFLRKRNGGAGGFILAPPVTGPADKTAQQAPGPDSVVMMAEGFVVAADVTPAH